jgi:HAD superfamily hydrolase (TIGR01509 family)
MAEFDLIIFDCDGVLIDSEKLSCTSLRDQLGVYGIEMDLAEVLRRFLGRSVAEIGRHYQAMLGRPMPAAFVVELAAAIRAAFVESLAAMPHVETLLQRLRNSFCLASSSDLERVQFSLNLAGLSDYFEGRMFTSAMVERGKPAPDLFLLAAARMKAAPGRCLVIEDSISGVEAGKAAGMTVWGFVGGSHYAGLDGPALLQAAGADRVFARMTEIDLALDPARRLAG